MTQSELNAAVAAKTGESIREIERRGFVIVDHGVVAFDPEPPRRPLVIDWDEFDSRFRFSAGRAKPSRTNRRRGLDD
jgi:hypothetical protein